MVTTFEYYHNIVNKALLSESLFSRKVPPILKESMLYSLCTKGKRLRPVLFLCSAILFGAKVTTIIPIALGIEMMHTYSLIHDDLPSIDNDMLRRGEKTNHIIFGEDIALLAGDALLTEAFSHIFSAKLSAKRILHIAQIFSSTLGAEGVVGGQILDIHNKTNTTLEEVNVIHKMKTVSFISSCCEAGALTGTQSRDNIALLTEYGKNLGHALQIMNDILDKVGTEKTTGKTIGQDTFLGKRTYPDIVGITKAREDAKKYAKNAQKCLTSLHFSSSIQREKEAFGILENLTEYIIKEPV
ncbi:MAG: polyprenyl synthetase family protein [Desulfovibrionaceae bacterium]